MDLTNINYDPANPFYPRFTNTCQFMDLAAQKELLLDMFGSYYKDFMEKNKEKRLQEQTTPSVSYFRDINNDDKAIIENLLKLYQCFSEKKK